MSTRTIAAVLILIGILIAINYDKKQAVAPVPGDDTVVCTQEAKQCPDGSYVGRTGPQCQFADCPKVTPNPIPPVTKQKGIVKGRVTISPVCPVERNPPDPACAPRPYQTKISFVSVNNTTYSTTSDVDGNYSIFLDSGLYEVHTQGGIAIYPSCPIEKVSLQSGATLSKDISCDSGIR